MRARCPKSRSPGSTRWPEPRECQGFRLQSGCTTEAEKSHWVLALAFQRFDERDLVVLVVIVGVLQTVKAAAFREARIRPVVDHHIKAVECIQQTVRVAHRHGCGVFFYFQYFYFRFFGRADRRQFQAVEAAVLVRGDHTALIIECHRHP